MTPTAPLEFSLLDRRAHLNYTPLVEALTRRRFLALAAAASAAMVPQFGQAQSASSVRPYLQTVTPDSIWVCWRTDAGTNPTVSYGPAADALTTTVSASTLNLGTNYKWHSVQLTGLTPNTYYHYRVANGGVGSEVFRFRTLPPRGSSTGKLRFLVVGDNQIKNEPRYETILARAKAKIEAQYGQPIEQAIDVMLNVGDQVDVGTLDHYQHVHLAKEAEITPNLAVMTIIGNHETYSDAGMTLYRAHFAYDALTYQGITSPGGDTYYVNHVGNVLFLHLNSEDTSAAQTNWIQQIVNAAKNDPQVEFMVSLCHRPYQAEQYVGDISSWYRNTIAPILAQTVKHVLNIGAHHHLYARGQMREWPVYHIISGGTAWDQFWGQSTEQDLDDVQKTIANWAWQILEFDLTNRRMEVTCYAEAHPKLGFVYPSRVIDTFHRQFGVAAPNTPSLSAPPASTTLPYTLVSSAFATTSTEALNSTQFQIATDSGFAVLKVDRIRDYENIYGDSGAPAYTPRDTHAAVDILKWTIAQNGLPNGTYYARVRHRDTNCAWSSWSTAVSFAITGSSSATPTITLAKTIYAYTENITITFENAPGNTKDWIGIYKKGQTPGSSTPSTTWGYLNGSQSAPGTAIRSGSITLTADIAEKQEWYAVMMVNDGYTLASAKVAFYVGSTPVLSAGKTAYDVGETVTISYTSAPAAANDWIGVYRVGKTPGTSELSDQWYYLTTGQASGSKNYTNLPKGFYFAAYFSAGGYFELGSRLLFSVGSDIATVSLVGGNTMAYGSQMSVTFADGAGTPKDYIGIFVKGATAGVDRLVTYQYVGGRPSGAVVIQDTLPAGEYFLALYINDSYTEISNEYEFSITGGPAMPQVESVKPGLGNQLVIGLKVQPGAMHRLEKSTDLVNWTPVQEFLGEGLRMDVTVSADAAVPEREFWRVVKP